MSAQKHWNMYSDTLELLDRLRAEVAWLREVNTTLYKALKEITGAMPEFPPVPVGPEDKWFVRTEAIKPLTMGTIRQARAALELAEKEEQG
jgi:hypothetical protein